MQPNNPKLFETRSVAGDDRKGLLSLLAITASSAH
jgi:hypothetical protein